MGDKMDSDDSSSCDMPMEVLNEILAFLPVKSLIRFTCVCKSWLCLIRTNPQFAMRHYLIRTTSCSRLMDNVDSIVEYSKTGRGGSSLTNPEGLRLSMYSLTDKKHICLVEKVELGPGLELFVSNFCHGIMCMYVYSKSAGGARILLYNPAISEAVTLPVPHNIGRYEFGFGFGFDPLSKDYKIVAVHELFGNSSLRVDVYSVRDGCWHSLGAKAIGPLEKYKRFSGVPVLNANGRILNWLGMSEAKPVFGLLSFDMVDEVFREISMPECGYPYHLLPSSACQACLCLGSFRSFDIWVLNGDGDDQDHLIWSKHVSLTFPDEDVCVSPTNLWMNSKELLLYVLKPKIGIAEMVLYDLGTQ